MDDFLMFPLLTMIPGFEKKKEQWGRYNLPRWFIYGQTMPYGSMATVWEGTANPPNYSKLPSGNLT